MSARVTVKDHGLAKLRADLEDLRRLTIRAGIQGADASSRHPRGDLSVGEVAALMEYGSDDGRIPARPFLRHTSESTATKMREALRGAVSDVVDGRAETADALAKVGADLRDEIRETIERASEWAVPLAASTIARKGHDRPLVDTGTMLDSVSFVVADGATVVREG
jgi:hypothetical protein